MPRKITAADTMEMSPADRFRLAQEILATLDEDFVADAERELIAARIESYRRNPKDVHRWEDVKREIFGA